MEDLIERLRFCANMHAHLGYSENSKLFDEAGKALTAAQARIAELEAQTAPRVKALVWGIGSHKTDFGDHIAMGLVGEYSCRAMGNNTWTLWLRERCLGDKGGGIRVGYPTQEAAKAAAQAHYEALILSALEKGDG